LKVGELKDRVTTAAVAFRIPRKGFLDMAMTSPTRKIEDANLRFIANR
jgi:hypothetical protein